MNLRRGIFWALSLILIYIVSFSLCFTTVASGESADPDDSYIVEGAGNTADNPYIISTPQQLYHFATSPAGTFDNKHIRLGADIDLSIYAETGWPGINKFSGSFDGNNFSISNLKVRVSSGNAGLFKEIGAAGTVKNLNIVNADVSGVNNVGAVAGRVRGDNAKLEYCYVLSGTITGKQYIGGIAGQITDEASAFNCYNAADVILNAEKNSYYLGGICGDFSPNGKSAKLSYCVNAGKVSTKGALYTTGSNGSRVGGIVGNIKNGGGILEYCVNEGVIEGGRDNTGGIAGFVAGCTFNFCINNGNVFSTIEESSGNASYVGGIAGQVYNLSSSTQGEQISFNNCVNNGNITSNNHDVGGIFGGINGGNKDIAASCIVDQCVNNGNVQGAQRIGGIVGYLRSNSPSITQYTLSNCLNTGTIRGTTETAGLIGRVSIHSANTAKMEYCYSYGVVLISSPTGIVAGLVYNQNFPSFEIKYCYYDTDVIADTELPGKKPTEAVRGTSQLTDVAGHPTATLKTPATFSSYSNEIWNIAQDEYPVLKARAYQIKSISQTNGVIRVYRNGKAAFKGFIVNTGDELTISYEDYFILDQLTVTGAQEEGEAYIVNDDVYINAVFEYVEYTVEFYVDEELYVTRTTDYNSNFLISPVEDPDKGTNYRFEGWYTQNGDEFDFSQAVLQDKQIYARFVRLYTLTVTNGTTEGGIYDENTTVGIKPLVPAGKRFVGWKEGEEIVSTDFYYIFTLTGDRTLTAIFEPIKYRVQVIGGSGSGEILPGESVEVVAESRTGYLFSGWEVNNSIVSDQSEYTFTPQGDVIIVAKYIADKITITLDPTGGTLAFRYYSALKGLPIGELYLPTREGYDFVGWSSQKGNAEALVSADDIAGNEDITLYAIWEEKEMPDVVSGCGANAYLSMAMLLFFPVLFSMRKKLCR